MTHEPARSRHEAWRGSAACSGSRVECLAGTAWLTLDGDRRDIVLRPGQSFLVDADAQVLVCALDGGATVVDVLEPTPIRHREAGAGSIRFGAWSIAAVCAGFASFALFELWWTLVDLSTALQRQGSSGRDRSPARRSFATRLATTSGVRPGPARSAVVTTSVARGPTPAMRLALARLCDTRRHLAMRTTHDPWNPG